MHKHPMREQVYEYVLSFLARNAGLPPTRQEIAAAIGLPRSAVQHHLTHLARQGRITLSHQSRGISIPGAQWSLPENKTIPLSQLLWCPEHGDSVFCQQSDGDWWCNVSGCGYRYAANEL